MCTKCADHFRGRRDWDRHVDACRERPSPFRTARRTMAADHLMTHPRISECLKVDPTLAAATHLEMEAMDEYD